MGNLLGSTAKRIMGQTGWTRELGWGRLDVGKAVAMAKARTGSAGTGRTAKVSTKAKKAKKAKKESK